MRPGGVTVDSYEGVVFVVKAGSRKWVFYCAGGWYTGYWRRWTYAGLRMRPQPSLYVNETALAKSRFKTGGMELSGTLAWRS